MNEYKVFKDEEVDKFKKWQLYKNDEMVKSYIDEGTALKVVEQLKELDKLKEEAPELLIIKALEEFIMSI